MAASYAASGRFPIDPAFRTSIRRAAAGERPFSPGVLGRVVNSAVVAHAERDTRTTATPVGLTARESEVLELISAGPTNGKIADCLHIGLTTVKTHVTSLMAKTGATNRVRLAILGLRG
jgi:DNA-binding NarL/FixJ family response regulator